MIVTFKLIIDDDKRTSLVLYKAQKLNKLLEEVVNVLDYSFPRVRITDNNSHIHITGLSNPAVFATSKTYLEEVFMRFADDDNDNGNDYDDFDAKWFLL